MAITFEIFNKQLGRVTVVVDDEDSDVLGYAWSLAGGKKSVGQYVKNAKLGYLHRVIAERMGLLDGIDDYGLSGRSIDHVNGDKMDNRRENLRLRTRKEQMTNPNDGLRVTNKSGVRGVSFIKAENRWYANVMIDGKTRSLGKWKTLEEAKAARQYWDAHGVDIRKAGS